MLPFLSSSQPQTLPNTPYIKPNTCKRRPVVLARLLAHLRGECQPGGADLATREDVSVMAPAHLLALMLAEEPTTRELACSQGLYRSLTSCWKPADSVFPGC